VIVQSAAAALVVDLWVINSSESRLIAAKCS
jgi:hypothetical protein